MPEGIDPKAPMPLWLCPTYEAAEMLRSTVSRLQYDGSRTWGMSLEFPDGTRDDWRTGDLESLYAAQCKIADLGFRVIEDRPPTGVWMRERRSKR